MAFRVIFHDSNAYSFEVRAQRYKEGRLTIPSKILHGLGIVQNGRIHLRLESSDGKQVFWEDDTNLISGAEIDKAVLRLFVKPGQFVRVTASKPN